MKPLGIKVKVALATSITSVVVVGIVTVLVIVYLIMNLFVDLLYGVLDPRIRYE